MEGDYRSLAAVSDEPGSSDAAVGVLPRIISGVALLSVGVIIAADASQAPAPAPAL